MLQVEYSIEKKYRKLVKVEEDFTNLNPLLPIFKDKSQWISALRVGELNAYPAIQNKAQFPLDLMNGPVGYYKVAKGYLPLFKPVCPVEFLFSFEELSKMYKKEPHEIFILPISSFAKITGIENLDDSEIKRFVTFTLNFIDVHCILTKEQILKVFGKNLFSQGKYFISSLNNYRKDSYYSEHHFELFDEIVSNIDEISERVAVDYRNFEHRNYQINLEKANTLLKTIKLVDKVNKQKYYIIPYEEFSMLNGGRTAYSKKSTLFDLLKLINCTPRELLSNGDSLLLSKTKPGILFEKKYIHRTLNINITDSKKIPDDYIEYFWFKNLLLDTPLNLAKNITICHVYNTRYNRYYVDIKKLANDLSQPILNEEGFTLTIPRENFKKFIVNNHKTPDIKLLGADNESFYVELLNDAQSLYLQFLVEFS